MTSPNQTIIIDIITVNPDIPWVWNDISLNPIITDPLPPSEHLLLCWCGSTTHNSINHLDCPFNPTRDQVKIEPSNPQSKLKDIECSVCLDTEDHSVKTKGQCDHTFHTKCIQNWVTEQVKIRQPLSCPLCRSNFV